MHPQAKGSLRLDKTSPLDAAYWRRHARGTVRFAESVATLRARGMRVFLEVGPAPVLTGMARQCTGDSGVVWLASLRRDREASLEMLSSLGALYALGHNPVWRAVEGAPARRRLALPTYAFQRQRHWLDLPRKKTPAAEHAVVNDAKVNVPASPPDNGRAVVPPVSQTADPVPGQDQEVEFADKLRAAELPDRWQLLQAFIREQAVRVLALDASQPIDTGQSLNDLGLDSLMALELRNALASGVKHTLPATVLFTHPSIDALTQYLCSDVLAADAAEPEELHLAGATARSAVTHDLVEGEL